MVEIKLSPHNDIIIKQYNSILEKTGDGAFIFDVKDNQYVHETMYIETINTPKVYFLQINPIIFGLNYNEVLIKIPWHLIPKLVNGSMKTLDDILDLLTDLDLSVIYHMKDETYCVSSFEEFRKDLKKDS